MCKNKKKRATTEKAKGAKSGAILKAASRLFETNDYQKITVANIALEAHVSKGTVFNYFSTKEEIFLALAKEYFTSFFVKLEELLLIPTSGEFRTPEALSIDIYEAVKTQPLLLKIIILLSGIIEKNVSYRSISLFKKQLLQHVLDKGNLLELKYTFIPPGSGKRFLLWTYGIIIGFQTLSNPEEIALQVIEKEEIDLFAFNFQKEFTSLINIVASGLRNN